MTLGSPSESPRPLPSHLSFSQRSGFTYCGEQWRLSRIWKAPETPSWALCGGSAVHLVTQAIDESAYIEDPPEVLSFAETLEREVVDRVASTGVPEEDFRASGRSSAAWPGKENKTWWLHHGPVMVQKWIEFVATVPWDIHEYPDADGALRPAIEVPLEITLPGGQKIVAYVDRVFRARSTGELVVVDIKSGANDPASPDQLGLYKVGLEQAFGEPVTWGYYWSARTGTTSSPIDLADYTMERIEWEYETFAYARDAGLFLANPGKQCGYCDVREFCYVQNGARADEVPRPWQQFPLHPEEKP